VVFGQTPAPAPAQSARQFRVLELEGTPYQRGLKHGKVLREQIQAGLALWKENLRSIARMGGSDQQIDPDVFIKKFMAETNYVPAIKKWTPGLLEEVRGIAEGAGVGFPTMLTFQLVDEYWVNGAAIVKEHCSAMGISATSRHSAVVAQNMDLEGFRDGFQTLLHIKEPSGLEQYILTMPGLIAMDGMNNRGVGVATNTVAQLAHNRDGLPVAFVVRGILERGSMAEVESFLKSVHHASGQNYTVGAKGRAAYFEASGGKVIEVSSNGAFIYHTNHPLVNDDYNEESLKEITNPNPNDNTRTRYEALKRHLRIDPGGDKVIPLIQETLRSHDSEQNPVCRQLAGKDAGFSYASMIMVLAPEHPYLIAAPGPPDRYQYAEFHFSGASQKK
jgi:hypothetical protein